MSQPRYVKVALLDRNFGGDVEAAAQSGAPYIQAGAFRHISNPFDPTRAAWADLAAKAKQLRERLAQLGNTTTKVITKWRCELYFEDPDLGVRPGWKDDWLHWMPRTTVEAGLKEWTDAGYTIVYSKQGTTIGGAFWDRVLNARATQLPGLYAWFAEPAKKLLHVGMCLTNMNNPDFRKWALAAAKDAHAKCNGQAFIMSSKAGWLLYPQTWRSTPTHKPEAGGPMHTTPYVAGGFENGKAWFLRSLNKSGIKVVLDESPATASGPWSWMVGSYKDIPGILLGEERAWP